MSDDITIRISGDPATMEGLRKGRAWLFWSGIIHLVVGVLAIVFPILASLAANFIIGWLFVFAGVAGLVSAFGVRGVGALAWSVLLSVLTLGAGLFVLFDPMSGLLALTLVVATVFVVEGVFQALFALRVRPAQGWVFVLGSAVISVGLGVVIALGLPGTSTFVLGVLLGVNFLSTGIAAVLLAHHIKKATGPE